MNSLLTIFRKLHMQKQIQIWLQNRKAHTKNVEASARRKTRKRRRGKKQRERVQCLQGQLLQVSKQDKKIFLKCILHFDYRSLLFYDDTILALVDWQVFLGTLRAADSFGSSVACGLLRLIVVLHYKCEYFASTKSDMVHDFQPKREQGQVWCHQDQASSTSLLLFMVQVA